MKLRSKMPLEKILMPGDQWQYMAIRGKQN